jgi:CTP:molybdopterin cytidylyltransferase MocA
VSYCVCSRVGVEAVSAAYISGYLGQKGDMPNISLDQVVKVAEATDDTGRHLLEPRKEPNIEGDPELDEARLDRRRSIFPRLAETLPK